MYRRSFRFLAVKTPPNTRRERPEGREFPGTRTATGEQWYGVPENSNEFMYITKVGSHHYGLTPVLRTKSEAAHDTIKSLVESMNPIITTQQIERARNRVQVMDKKEKQKVYAAFMMVYFERLCNAFKADEHAINHKVFEKMCFPKYLPSHAEVREAFKLRRKLWYTPETYTTLENLSRLPMENADEQQQMKVSFEEWYSLFLNYYQNFHPMAFYAEVVGNSIIYTREFIDSLATYLAYRCAIYGETTAPIVDCMTQTGRLAYLLNETKKIPVEVVGVHEIPKPNPYLLHIPAQFQKEFALPKIRPMKVQDALQQYRPSIVLCESMPPEHDISRLLRAEGSVKEYILLGIPNSAINGHPWYTWGFPPARPQDDANVMPHHMQAGFHQVALPHISRYLFHKSDNDLAHGFAQCVSFHKVAYTFPNRKRWEWFSERVFKSRY